MYNEVIIKKKSKFGKKKNLEQFVHGVSLLLNLDKPVRPKTIRQYHHTQYIRSKRNHNEVLSFLFYTYILNKKFILVLYQNQTCKLVK